MTTAPMATRMMPTMKMPLRRVWGAYAAETRFETLRHLRAPAFAAPFLAIPVTLYLLFGTIAAGPNASAALNVPVRLFTGFGIVGIMGPALFAFGMAVALDREQGLLKLKRALPMPPVAYLLGKMCMAMLFSALVMLSLVVAATATRDLGLSAGQFASVVAISILGTLPFCAIGLFIGSRVAGRTAPAFVNLAYLPMVYLSGLFFPLPPSIQNVVLVSPAFHLNQLASQAAGLPRILPPAWHIAALVGVTVLFAGLAVRRVVKMG
jgi:ABC-2 type transport system permease protein